jgi:hypothetical protein
MTAVDDLEQLYARRLVSWCQTPETRLPDAAAAAGFIERVGLATLFPASPEIPNLFHAHTGDPAAQTESKWDSPAGHVYGWRWALGRPGAGFYTAIVRGRPTWVAWDLLPAVLRLRGTLRPPDELYAAGELSASAYRIVQVLTDCGGVLSTSDLRALAGFPTGKAERAAYLKAIAELDARLLLAKVFADDDEDMRHALVGVRYPQHTAAAAHLSYAAALEQLLITYLAHAKYVLPATLARHLGLPATELRTALQVMADSHRVTPRAFPEYREIGYVWTDSGPPPGSSELGAPTRVE